MSALRVTVALAVVAGSAAVIFNRMKKPKATTYASNKTATPFGRCVDSKIFDHGAGAKQAVNWCRTERISMNSESEGSFDRMYS